MNQKTIPSPLRVRVGVGGITLEDDAVGLGHFATVATVIQRDPNPVHGEGITRQEAHSRACMLAAAPLVQYAARDLLGALHHAQLDTHPAIRQQAALLQGFLALADMGAL